MNPILTTITGNHVVTETHEYYGFTITVSYYSKTAAGPDTQPLYSCSVTMSDGRKSGELVSLNDPDTYPLSRNSIWRKINDFIMGEEAIR